MKKLTFILTLFFTTSNLSAQTVIYVRVDGTGDGTSWADAANLETAMTIVETHNYASLPQPIQIRIQHGYYMPSTTLIVPNGVELYGGFLGNETHLSQRNFAENRTIIDGQKRFGVVKLGIGAVLDGFAIINGHSHVKSEPLIMPYGGGIWMEENARVENCYVLDNTASELGGGIYAEGDGLVYNTLFSGNAAGEDGLAIHGTTVEVRNVTVSENYRFGDPVTVDTNYCNIATPAWIILGKQSFATDSVWLVDTMLWSDAVTMNTCQKTMFDGGYLSPPTFHSDCRSNPGYKGDLFSWCAVKRYGEFLCPDGWRVPTAEEFCELDKILNSRENCDNRSDGISNDKYLTIWGGILGGGYYHAGEGIFRGFLYQGMQGTYWSQSEVNTVLAFTLSFGHIISPQGDPYKNYGYALRCVRFCPRIVVDIADEITRHQEVCPGEPIVPVVHTFGVGAGHVLPLQWDIIPEGISGNATSFSGMPTTAGVYNWTITTIGSGDEICPPKISTGSITVHALPATVVVGGTTPACDSTILTASNGNDGIIFWQNTTNNGTSTAVASTSQTVKSSGTYYFRARSDEGCWSEQGSHEVVIYSTPTIHRQPDTTEQVTLEGVPFPHRLTLDYSGYRITSIQWYSNTIRANTGGTAIPGATEATHTPSPLVADTLYYYCVITNACGSVVSDVSGRHIVIPPPEGCNSAIPGWGNSFGVISFATDSVWVVGNQVWSDAVQATNCNKETFNDGTYTSLNADCRLNPHFKGDYFSWCAVMRFQDQLCPGNWRVPTRQEFIDLDIALGGTGTSQGLAADELNRRYVNTWGGDFKVLPGAPWAYYWSQTYDNSCVYFLQFHQYAANPSVCAASKRGAISLRCVRDTVLPVGCNGNTPGWGSSLGVISFATDSIWVVGNQVWSDAVQATNCSNKTTFNGGSWDNINADCRSNPDYKGDFFSGCAVSRFQNELCPHPWRVPTVNDFINLVDRLGLNSAPYINIWGSNPGGGYAGGNNVWQRNQAHYWTLDEPRWLIIRPPNGEVTGPMQSGVSRSLGASLRCVRTANAASNDN